MRLVKLSSNMKSFHTIEFKEGLNLIVGSQANPSEKDNRKTYNGVGKSLIIYLIHFCLGSNKIDAFEKSLPNWTFELTFEIENEIYVTSRNTSKQSEFFLNGVKKTITKFREEMLSKVFYLDDDSIQFLGFNSLFPRFIRRDRECYTQYDNFVNKEQEYSKLLNNSYLLGLDTSLIINKATTRKVQNNIEKLSKNIMNDDILKEYFQSNVNDADIEILDLKEEIEKLTKKIDSFEVAEDFHEIEVEVSELRFLKKELENKRTLLNNKMKNIEKSIAMPVDESIDKVLDFYEKAKIEIPNILVKQIEEAVSFHESLLVNRKNRLFKDLQKYRKELIEIENEIGNVGKHLETNLRYLKSHGALNEYDALSKKINELSRSLQKLEEYQGLMKQYKKKTTDIKGSLSEQNILTNEYLNGIADLQEKIITTFRDLSKEFYDKPGGIKIENNEGENLLRYKISAKIQDDSSDGVNEVKIFCYDMTMLMLQLNHNMKFLFHDSRLFSNMDPRQRYTLFKLVYSIVNQRDLQYIASINEDTIDSFKDLMLEGEYNSIIEDNIILTLTDDSAESKLLGIQIDMEYNK